MSSGPPASGVAGILLAAGGGSRLGRPKALVEIGGRTLAARGVSLLRAGGADPIVVVTGAAPVELPGVTLVTNPDWRTGMGSSLVAGLSAVRDLAPESCPAVVIALADQPLIGPEAVRRLIAAHAAGAAVAVAAYDGRPRNPVLIGRAHWAEVLATTSGDAGARPFLRAHPDLVTAVECAGTGRPDDIDTPDDLARVIDLAELLLRPGLATVRRARPSETPAPPVRPPRAPGRLTIEQ
jgi:nicotine blue oxidoreductase